jgi:hypothetical protein
LRELRDHLFGPLNFSKKTSPETVRSKIKGSDFCQKITYRIGFVRDVEKKTGPDGKETEEVV